VTPAALDTVVAHLQADEGFRESLYDDSEGVPTIGYGTALRGWSQRKASTVLLFDVNEAIDGVLGALPWSGTLSEARFGVLVEMCYNLGLNGLLGFHDFLGHLQRAEWPQAGMQLLASVADHEEPARVQRWIAEITNG
jgi:lysozyme